MVNSDKTDVSPPDSMPEGKLPVSTKRLPNGHILFLDDIRGLAIIIVFFYHALGASFGVWELPWNGWIRGTNVPLPFLALSPLTMGYLGVAVFFVVSGFCIHLAHQTSKIQTFTVFFVRRFFRIYPPYFLALCIFAYFFPGTKLPFDSFRDYVQLWSHVVLVHNLNGASFYSINGSFWSIAIEVQLYILYPFLLFVVRRFGWAGALWLTACSEIGLRGIQVFHPIPFWLALSPFAFWFSWSIGAKIADDHLNRRKIFLARFSPWLWPVVTIFIFFLFKPLYIFVFLTAALSAAVGIAHLLKGPEQRIFVPSFMRLHLGWVGKISYSMYLLHQPLIIYLLPFLVAKIFPNVAPAPAAMFGLSFGFYLLVLAVSWGFYRYCELPSIQAGKYLINSRFR